MVILQDTFATNQVQASPLLVHQAADREQEHYDAKLALQEKFTQIQAHTTTQEAIAPSLEHFLEQKEGNQSLDYNLLPPTNRLIIPDLNINVPLIDAEAGGKIDFGNETFDAELMKGVVKYPTTPIPGHKGNTLIF
ncbi:MAG: hypothetical protein Q4B28_05980 [bacterium]|nr:hypothetical protein [bacterium]